MGDDRIEKNLNEGASKCKYAIIILSKHTEQSICAMEEITIINQRHCQRNITIFPILYELSPSDIPYKLQWIKNLIYKETDRHSGTLEICNHIACKITEDILKSCRNQNIMDILTN